MVRQIFFLISTESKREVAPGTLSADRPYLSFVVAARNDNHGGNFLKRMQLFVDVLFELVRIHQLNAELILVEWNPAPNTTRLYRAITWPTGLKVRVIEVPRHLHKRFRYSDRLPLFQMIAKNVGIRRARGEFVLATNVDLLFSSELVEFLASSTLNPKYMYRIDRFDVSSRIPANVPVEDQLEFCAKNVIRVNTQQGTFPSDYLHWFRLKMLWRNTESLFRYLLRIISKLSKVRPHINGARKKSIFLVSLWKRISRPYPQLHTNACGDFTLLAREKWRALRGYPELEMYSLHLDSILLHMAYQYGLRQRTLGGRMRLYHLEHDLGWTPANERELYRRWKRLGVPILEFRELEILMTKMQKEKRPLTLNKKTWGLATENLPEIEIN